MGMTDAAIEARDGFDADDLRTHYSAWRKALDLARAACEERQDADGASYWEHETRAFDRTMLAITGGPDGDPIEAIAVTRKAAATAEASPDGPGGWWGDANPWHDRAVYVSADGLARALGHGRVPDQWLEYSTRLDAYLLRQPDGSFIPGVRFGPGASDYLSPYSYGEGLQTAFRALAAAAPEAEEAPAPGP